MEGRAPSFILELLWHLCGVKKNKKSLSKENLSPDLDLNSGSQRANHSTAILGNKDCIFSYRGMICRHVALCFTEIITS
jgi:hypothetical protein